MKLRILAALLGLLVVQPCVHAASTIDPTVPGQSTGLTSAPVRGNFTNAYNDINNILGQYAGSAAPTNPLIGQYWRKTNVTPNLVYQWTGAVWAQVATFDTIGNAVTPYFGNALLAWQELIPGLGTSGQCIRFNGPSSVPTAQNCLSSSNISAAAPLLASFSGIGATLSLNLDSNFAVSGGNLALSPIASGTLLCNPSGSPAEPGPCSWNQFASQALGTVANSFPIYSAGTWNTKTLGTSVADPGTGTIEALVPVQTNFAAGAACTTSCNFSTSDFFKRTRRSNSGSAMSDTLPAAGAQGLANGTRIQISNVDSTATDTITAGVGTTILGASSFALGPGRDLMLVYDLANTAWRNEGNTSTSLLAPNNLSDLSSVATARTNLGLGGLYSVPLVAHQWITSIAAGTPSQSQPSFADLSGQAALAQLPNIAADSILGNPTASGSSALAGMLLPNCTGALTYSTTTHSVGCNVGAGTGTMTSLTPGGGLVSSTTANCSQTAITNTGALSAGECVNAQSGTTYTFVDGDRAKLITASNVAAQAYTLPQAGASSQFVAGWYADIQNINTPANPAGIVTITPTTSTINGLTSYKVYPGQSGRLISDGTNYRFISSVAPGDWQLVNTLVASAAASVSDTTSIGPQFQDYEIVIENLVPSVTTGNCLIQVHSGGSFQTTSYQSQSAGFTGSSVASRPASTSVPCDANDNSWTSAASGVQAKFVLFNPLQTSAPKVISGYGCQGQSGSSFCFVNGGSWAGGNGAVDGFQIAGSSGTFSGIIKVYARQ